MTRRARPAARITHIGLPTPAALGRALAQAIHAQQAAAATTAKGQTQS
jgi:hypothetical protein